MSADLPDFHSPHDEKISWMVETNGWAIESVPPGASTWAEGVPMPTYSYTVNFPAAFGMPEVVILGLTPVACRGLFDLIADVLGSGQTIEIGAEIVGLFDGEQRAKFVDVDMSIHGQMFASAGSWHKGRAFGVVQMVWPDRNGFLPGEAGFDQRLRFTQPLLG